MTIRTNKMTIEITLSKDEYIKYAEYCNEYMDEMYKYDIQEIQDNCDDFITIDEDMLTEFGGEENSCGFYMWKDDFYYLLKYAFVKTEVSVHPEFK